MNLVRKIKISKITNQPLSDKELEIYNFIYDKLKDLKPFTSDEYPDSIFYGLNRNEIYLEQDDGNDTLWVQSDYLWNVLETKYNIEYDCIGDIISSLVLHILKFKPNTPRRYHFNFPSKTLKLKIYTDIITS